MKTHLISHQTPPEFDQTIVQFVQDSGEPVIDGKEMVVGIAHNNQIYRHIICTGLPEYLSCVGFLAEELELTDLLVDKPAQNGVDSLFAKQQ